jgi:hypothetical protein
MPGNYGQIGAQFSDRGNLKVNGTSCERVYQTEAHGNPVCYRLHVPAGTYNVILHFAETWFREAGQRNIRIKVKAAESEVKTKIDPFMEGGGFARPAIVRFENMTTDGQFDIELCGEAGINGIELEKI